jgi:HEAT repeat protein/DNA polymerase III delta prime subunit
MAHEAFISYSNRDKPTADAVRTALEDQGIRCWIAPRDVTPGIPFGQSIIEAIHGSRLLVLVFSSAANASQHVMREVEGAVGRRIPILPLRIEDAQPSGSMAYFLQSIHWLDALTPLLEDHLQPVVDAAQTLLARGDDGRVAAPVATSSAGDKVRARYLKSVKEDVENRLRVSIHNARFIDLGIDVTPAATHLPWIYRDPDSSQEFDRVEDAFASYHRRLLLLGAPGAGKTTTLLHLARHLIAAAERDPHAPVPLLVNLSQFRLDAPKPSVFARWLRRHLEGEERDRRVERWLVGELTRRPGISTEVARKWIEEDRVAVLMDGLDEVDDTYRAEIVRLLNDTFLFDHPETIAVVCSRVNEYRPLQDSKETRLQLGGAVTLQPLTNEQIEGYLDAAKATGLRASLPNDESLHELAQTPLTLSMMTLAYGGLAPSDIPAGLSLTQRRHHLMEAYVARMLQRKERRDRGIPFDQSRDNDVPERKYQYRPEQVMRYLGWLAVRLSVRMQTAFSLERLHEFLAKDLNREPLPAVTWGVTVVRCMLGILVTLAVGIALMPSLVVVGVLSAPVVALLFIVIFALSFVEISEAHFPRLIEENLLSPILLRLIALSDSLPRRCEGFIVYATGALLLKQPNSGIEFMHRFLRDYFALRDLQPILSERNLDRQLVAIRNLGFLGESAIDSLVEFARDPDPRIREVAVSALAKIAAPQVVQHIETALKDPEVIVRRASVLSFWNLGEEPFRQLVRRTIREKDIDAAIVLAGVLLDLDRKEIVTLFREVVESLGRFGDARAVELLMAVLAKREETVLRVAAADAFGRLGDARAVEPLINVLVNREETMLCMAAAEALGRLGDARAVEPLLMTMADWEDYELREAAAEALIRLGDARAVEPLIIVLTDREETILREAAAEALVRLGNALAVEPLISALADQEEVVRAAAAEALGQLGDARAVEPLINALVDREDDVRWAAAEALGQLGDTRAVEPLQKALTDRVASVCGAAAEALGQLGDTHAVDFLLRALNDPMIMERGVAAWALGRLRDARAVEPLLEALEDWKSVVRRAAAIALGRLGDTRAVEPLILALANLEPSVRSAAAWALGRLGDARAVEPLIIAMGDWDTVMRIEVARALGQLGDARAVELLLMALIDPKESVRRGAAWALGLVGDTRAVEALIMVLGDREEAVPSAVALALGRVHGVRTAKPLIRAPEDREGTMLRATAAEALGMLKDTRAVEPLLDALEDREEDVRRVAAWALCQLGAAGTLGRFGDALAVEPLLRILEDREEDVLLVKVVEALGQLGDARAVEPLITAMKDGAGYVCVAAAEALGQLGDARAVEPLIKALEDREYDVLRATAADALGRLGDARAVEPLQQAQEDPVAGVRNAVARALDRLGHRQS